MTDIGDLKKIQGHLRGIAVWFDEEGAEANAQVARDAAAAIEKLVAERDEALAQHRVRLQAKRPDESEWLDIFPSQLAWASQALDVRALEEIDPSYEADMQRLHEEKCANWVRAEAAESRLKEAMECIRTIVKENADFRAGMPPEWEGDPLQDAIDAANFNVLIKEAAHVEG